MSKLFSFHYISPYLLALCLLVPSLDEARSETEATSFVPKERPAADQQTPSGPAMGDAQAFSPERLTAYAEKLAKTAYVPEVALDENWGQLTFDQHRAIRFRKDHALPILGDGPLELQLLPPGRETNNRVRVNMVEGGEARTIMYDHALFSFDPGSPDNLTSANLDFSGFRLHAALNDHEGDEVYLDEFLVFQGASYFRAVAKGQSYGLSARGLAISTGGQAGEEFPIFKEFWIETSTDSENRVTIYALLDSPSVVGVYTFKISPGQETRADISAIIFPRTEIHNFGLAPLTSMFLFDETNRHRFEDFRTAAHDSDGLAIHNGAGERLWRPLANPTGVQESAFVDRKPRGFGLIQRARKFEEYGDLALNYQDRPSVWIEPKGNWGAGSVTLVEFPTKTETDDNIVAYWRPAAPFLPGVRYEFGYKQIWTSDAPNTNDLLKVIDSRLGVDHTGRKIVVIDYLGADLLSRAAAAELAGSLKPEVLVGTGIVHYPVVEANPHTGGVRLTFQYDPQETNVTEFRVLLRKDGQAVSEKWLYRWTR